MHLATLSNTHSTRTCDDGQVPAGALPRHGHPACVDAVRGPLRQQPLEGVQGVLQLRGVLVLGSQAVVDARDNRAGRLLVSQGRW